MLLDYSQDHLNIKFMQYDTPILSFSASMENNEHISSYSISLMMNYDTTSSGIINSSSADIITVYFPTTITSGDFYRIIAEKDSIKYSLLKGNINIDKINKV